MNKPIDGQMKEDRAITYAGPSHQIDLFLLCLPSTDNLKWPTLIHLRLRSRPKRDIQRQDV